MLPKFLCMKGLKWQNNYEKKFNEKFNLIYFFLNYFNLYRYKYFTGGNVSSPFVIHLIK